MRANSEAVHVSFNQLLTCKFIEGERRTVENFYIKLVCEDWQNDLKKIRMGEGKEGGED